MRKRENTTQAQPDLGGKRPTLESAKMKRILKTWGERK
jgi:hypothetical protein